MKIDVNRLIAQLDFSETNVAGAMLEQAKLLLEASYYRVDKMRKRMRAEAAWNEVLASTALRIRSEAEGGSRITDKAVGELVENDKQVAAARKGFNEAKAMEEWAKLLI